MRWLAMVVLVGCGVEGQDGSGGGNSGENSGEENSGTEPVCAAIMTDCIGGHTCSACAPEDAVAMDAGWYECSDGYREEIDGNNLNDAAMATACHCYGDC